MGMHVRQHIDAPDLNEDAAGDWLMQYAPGDFGIVAGARFNAVYRVQGKRT